MIQWNLLMWRSGRLFRHGRTSDPSSPGFTPFRRGYAGQALGPRTGASIVCLTILVASLAPEPAYADKDRRGTAGAAHLRVVPTAGLTSLGASGAAGALGLSGVELMFVNPAGLTLNHGTGVLFSRMEYLVDVELNYIGVAQQIGANQLGFFLSSWNVGRIPRQTETNPEISDLTFEPEIITAGFSYARNFTDRISAGVTVKIVNEDIDDMVASAVALDGGLTYSIAESGLRFGLSVRNIGSRLQYSGTGLSRKTNVPDHRPDSDTNTLFYESEPVDLPAMLNVGMSYTRSFGAYTTVSLLANFRSNSFDQDEYSTGIQIGLLDALYVRGGLEISPDQDLTLFSPGTLGAGLDLDVSGLGVSIDYAYRPTDFFSDVQIFTIDVAI